MGDTNLSGILAGSGLPPAELARRAGVSRNTEWTLRHDTSKARINTLRELALACGLEIHITTEPASDPLAAAAARAIVGDLDPETVEEADRLHEWIRRLQRWVPDEHPLSIIQEAAAVSAPQRRASARFMIGRNDVTRLASAAIASGTAWALSGGAALTYLEGTPDNDALPAIVWTSDVDAVSSLLAETHRTTTQPHAANVIIAPLHPTTLAGSATIDDVTLVSPIHAVIDSIGAGGELGRAAHDLAESW